MAASGGNDIFSDDLIGKASVPTTKFIEWFHQRAGSGPDDLHHLLGYGPNDASPGNHRHDGVGSSPLFNIDAVPADLPASPTTAQIRDTVNAMLALLRTVAGAVD